MGSISLDTLVLAKKYTDKVLTGLGELKGSPCTIKATKENDDGSVTVTFAWTGSDGVEETQDVIIPAGPQGTQGEQGEKGTDGTNGVSPTVTITEIEDGHTITITDADGTQSFNVLNGADGAGEENVIEEIKVNGVALAPDENKSVNITVPTVDVDKNYVDTELAKKANTSDIPTNVSELHNDSKYQTDADVDNKLASKADKTEIPTFTNKTVLDGITAEKVENWDEAVTTKTALEAHTNNIVSSETGVHGMRYFNDTLQVQNEDNEWIDIESGGGGIAPSNVSDLKIKVGNTKLTILWSDPGNTVVEGQTLCTWKGTKLVMKAGAYPENAKDGTVLVDNQVLDAYKTNGFEISNLNNGTTYYFALFPYSDTGATNLNTANRISGTPQPYRTMTAVIDLTNSNPLSSVTYEDDAVGMTKGSEDWDEFLGYYPVLLDASGNELGKLNPNNYAQYEDGTSAPINTLGSYDVMVAFPKRGLKISTANNKVTISMTDDPDNEDFKYYAHSYGAHNNCDLVYVGAYKASANGTKLYSCSGQSPLVSQTIGALRTYANNRGTGYEQMTFYVRTFLCCAYILRFGNLNSQAAVGQGYVNASAKTNTGATNAQGMNYGTTSQTTQIKCLGIEDLWGNVFEWVDGIFSSSTRNILTAIYNKNMNDTGSGYQDNGQGASSDIGNYMSKPQGTTETGFVAKEVSGSTTTYFCDYANLYASRVACAGGSYGNTGHAGVFRLNVNVSASYSSAYIGGRLIKFKVAA